MNMENEFLIEMGKRVTACRKEHRLTQEQLADKMDVSLQTVSCIELGKKAIRPENLAKLCIATETSADYILFGKRSEKQISGTVNALSSLSDEDYKLVTSLVFRLSEKK